MKAVCPIQLSENCSPRFFSPQWWDLFEHVHRECKRLGMNLWLYDQVGYGDYGWFDKALEHVKGGTPTFRLVFLQGQEKGTGVVLKTTPVPFFPPSS